MVAITRVALLFLFVSFMGCTSSPSSTANLETPPEEPDSQIMTSGQFNGNTSKPTPSEILSSVYLLKSYNSEGDEISQGSGFLSEGVIISNAHVIADAAWVEVYDSQGRHITTAAYAIHIDLDSDLAVLPYPGSTLRGLKIRSKKPELGEMIWAYGSPLGLQNTVTTGNVSGFREVNKQERIQISAPISQGSSGGPVVDENGLVIGIVVSTYQEGQNLNFAVPSYKLPSLNSLASKPIKFPQLSELNYSDNNELSKTQILGFFVAMQAEEAVYGESYLGVFNPKQNDLDREIEVYSFEGMAGDHVEFASSSDDGIDTNLVLIDESWIAGDESPTGTADDDSGLGNNPVIRTTLVRDGTYYVTVSAPKGTKGRYVLHTKYIPDNVALDRRWVLISSNHESEEYIDSNSIQIRNSNSSYYDKIATAWIYSYSYEPEIYDGKSSDRVMFKFEYNCSKQTSHLENFSRRIDDTWESINLGYQATKSVTPGTKGEIWLNSACSMK